MQPAPHPGLPNPVELLVVGGGTAGLIAAKTAASFGAEVVLVERDPAPGGDCLWTGCVPSKTLLSLAGTVAAARRSTELGLQVSGSIDGATIRDRVRAAVRTIAPVDSTVSLEKAGIRVLRGSVVFTGPDRADIDGWAVTFRRAVLATGASPALLTVSQDQAPLTSETVWDLNGLPRRLLIVGGGSTGCELAQAFTRLGTTVTIVERAPRLLPGEDPDAGALLGRVLTEDGVELRTGRSLHSVQGGTATLDDGSRVEVDQWLCAVGRRPRTEDWGWPRPGCNGTRTEPSRWTTGCRPRTSGSGRRVT